MITKLLRLRVLQLHRLLSATGYLFVLIAIVIAGGILFRTLAGLVSLPSQSAIPIAALALASLHFSRKDLNFLRDISVSKTAQWLYLSLEYALLLLPINVFQLISGKWWTVLGLSVIPFLISLVPISLNSLKWKSRIVNLSFLPVSAFELKITIERYIAPVAVLWMISFFGFVHPAFLLVSLLLFLFTIVDGYTYNESLELMSYNQFFMVEKIGLHIAVVTLLFGIQFLISGYFHPDSLLILFAGYGYMVIIMALAITSKYANYDPLRQVTLNSTSLIVAMILGLLPGLILGSLIVSIYYYFKAKKNLAYYAS